MESETPDMVAVPRVALVQLLAVAWLMQRDKPLNYGLSRRGRLIAQANLDAAVADIDHALYGDSER